MDAPTTFLTFRHIYDTPSYGSGTWRHTCIPLPLAHGSGGRRPAVRPSGEIGADLTHGPRLVRGGLAFWLQTNGEPLLTIRQGSLTRVRLVAQYDQ
jgi:hypothetical protein